MKQEWTRKEFLKVMSVISSVVLSSGALLSACGSSEKKAETEKKPAEDPCADLSGLTDEEKAVREEFEYVATSPNPEELCKNCALWIEPEPGSQCGGCEIMKGPIHPEGWCSVWVAIE